MVHVSVSRNFHILFNEGGLLYLSLCGLTVKMSVTALVHDSSGSLSNRCQFDDNKNTIPPRNAHLQASKYFKCGSY